MKLDMMVIGKRLRTLRGARTIQQVSDETGIAWSNICCYELGRRRPSDENKITLANYYGVPVQNLFFDEDMTFRNNNGE